MNDRAGLKNDHEPVREASSPIGTTVGGLDTVATPALAIAHVPDGGAPAGLASAPALRRDTKAPRMLATRSRRSSIRSGIVAGLVMVWGGRPLGGARR
jgi:hypothetical protein